MEIIGKKGRDRRKRGWTVAVRWKIYLISFQHLRTQLNAPIEKSPERYPNNRNKTAVGGFHQLGYCLWVREAASARRSGTGSSRWGHVGFVCVCLWDREMGRNLGGMRVGLDGFDTVERVMSRETYGFWVGSSEKTRIRCGSEWSPPTLGSGGPQSAFHVGARLETRGDRCRSQNRGYGGTIGGTVGVFWVCVNIVGTYVSWDRSVVVGELVISRYESIQHSS